MNGPTDYEEAWDNTDTKTLLAQMLAELGAIRQELAAMNAATEPRSESETETDEEPDDMDTVQCQTCHSDIPKSDRKRHAIEEHNAPPGISADALRLYE